MADGRRASVGRVRAEIVYDVPCFDVSILPHVIHRHRDQEVHIGGVWDKGALPLVALRRKFPRTW